MSKRLCNFVFVIFEILRRFSDDFGLFSEYLRRFFKVFRRPDERFQTFLEYNLTCGILCLWICHHSVYHKVLYDNWAVTKAMQKPLIITPYWRSAVIWILVMVWETYEILLLNNSRVWRHTIYHRSFTHSLGSCDIKARKKIWAWTGFEPMTSAIPVQCSTNWAIKPTGGSSLCKFII